ncbi:hypothetical protein ACG02S_20095 [Roseateles sp. DC23W]|uniref:TonB C-terminal domain-containing protein n=1 Tax=Pelomonas dachongensis TaxID=3299029 RepID=A0ABW7ES08_9BURK
MAHVGLIGIWSDTVLSWQRERLQAPHIQAPQPVVVRQLDLPEPSSALEGVIAEARPTSPSEAASAPSRASSEPLALDSWVTAPVAASVYVPRGLLSTAPVPRGAVPLLWPQNWHLKASYTAVLKLYLDEEGTVERVELDGDARLPDPLFEAARDAFMAVGFTPGQLNGKPVKCWTRVEVSFDHETRMSGH